MGRVNEFWEKVKIPLLGILCSILLLIILAILLEYVVMPLYTQHGQEMELPDVTERSFEDAMAFLESAGFAVIEEPVRKYNSNYPDGTVLFQKPEPYSHVKKGRRIYLTLSAGERRVPIPRVIGISERDAEFHLKRAGLTLGEVFYDYSNHFPRGVVSQQQPQAGDTLSENGVVDITVSNGIFPTKFIVPDVLGRSLDEAKKILMKSGLRLGKITYESTDQFVPETVLDQELIEGQEVESRTAVDLIVSRLAEDSLWVE